MKSRRRVIHGEVQHAVFFLGGAVDFSYCLSGEEKPHRITAQGHYHLGGNLFYLPPEPLVTVAHLFGERVTVIGGAAFDYVGDVDFGAV